MASNEEPRQRKSTKHVKLLETAYQHEQSSSRAERRNISPLLHNCTAYSISKPKASTFKVKSKSTMATLNFEKQMSEYIANLASESEKNLSTAELDLERTLNKLVDQLYVKCSILEGADNTLRKWLGDELMEVADPSDPQQRQEKSLQDITSAFSTMTEAYSDSLNELWEEWDDLQEQILCIAIEMYGEDTITTENAEISPRFQQRITDAVAQHELVSEQYKIADENLSNTEREVEDLVARSNKSINAQLKEIKVGQDRKKKALLKAFDEYTSTD